MKRFLILFSGLSLMVALYYGTSSDPEISQVPSAPALPEKKIEKENDSGHTVESHVIADFQIEESSGVDPDRDYLIWNKVNDEVETMWDKEIYAHIQYVDREHSDELYRLYLSERRDYLKTQDMTLAQGLNELSRLNGESIPDENNYDSPEMQHFEFTNKMRRLFRKQYAYIEDQRKIFLDSQENK